MNTDQALQRAVPPYSLAGLNILDVGCYNGYAFEASCFSEARSLHGVDVNDAAIAEGRAKLPGVTLSVAPAESLPYPDAQFDCVISRVALPYTDIPKSLREINRVLVPDGRVFLTMHDFRHQLEFMRAAVRDRAPKRLIDLTYVMLASALYSAFGICLRKPWNGRFETFQTIGRMRKDLQAAGFIEVSSTRTERHRIFQARKPPR